ncbi:MAG: hypothetical protein IJ806_02465 [Ruminococcus sp.]|nr:hypothetical protein [Ruminococcus sp.]
MSSFKNYKRNLSTGSEGSSVTVRFIGTGFAALGINQESCMISVSVDGQAVEKDYVFDRAGHREITYSLNGLSRGEHTAVITVLSGKYAVDYFEIYS